MAVLVPLVLLAIALVLVGTAWGRRPHPEAAPAPAKAILVHSINDDRCVGCDACVAVCPTNVLALQGNKARVIRFADCIQCEQCMWACPTQALVMHREDRSPPPIKLPNLDLYYQTEVPGLYLIGEVAGKPLVKNAANDGRAVIEHMHRQGLRPGRRPNGAVDVLIVGSGPGGLSAALTCIHYGLSYLVLEKEAVVAPTVARYPRGKDIMVEPYQVQNLSFLPVYDAKKEELLPRWHELMAAVGLRVRLGETVESILRTGAGSFAVRTIATSYRAHRVVLAVGGRGKPRALGVPGENLAKVAKRLDDAAALAGRDVLVVGGGDSAAEAACALADAGVRVALSYRGTRFARAQPKNRERISAYARAGRVALLLGSHVLGFGPRDVTLRLGSGETAIRRYDAALVLIGADAPTEWLERQGVTSTLAPPRIRPRPHRRGGAIAGQRAALRRSARDVMTVSASAAAVPSTPSASVSIT